MLGILRRHLARRKKERRIVWKALMKVFDVWDVEENVRPLLMHISYQVYGDWCRAGCASRQGTATAVKYIRLYKALLTLCGEDAMVRHWLKTPNTHFYSKVPVEYLLVGSEQHLDDVLAYAEGAFNR
jgi:hypothetical protein